MVNTKRKIVLPVEILREIQECIKKGEILNYNKYYKLFMSKEGSTYCSYNTFRTHLKELRDLEIKCNNEAPKSQVYPPPEMFFAQSPLLPSPPLQFYDNCSNNIIFQNQPTILSTQPQILDVAGPDEMVVDLESDKSMDTQDFPLNFVIHDLQAFDLIDSGLFVHNALSKRKNSNLCFIKSNPEEKDLLQIKGNTYFLKKVYNKSRKEKTAKFDFSSQTGNFRCKECKKAENSSQETCASTAKIENGTPVVLKSVHNKNCKPILLIEFIGIHYEHLFILKCLNSILCPNVIHQEFKENIINYCLKNNIPASEFTSHFKTYYGMKKRIYNVVCDQDKEKSFASKIESEFIPTLDSTITDPENFFAHKSKNILIFATEKNLIRLSRADIVVSDGTFRYVEKDYAQLYTVMGRINVNGQNIFVPLIYCLMKNKKKDSYDELLNFIELKFEKYNVSYSFNRWLLDKEMTVVNILKSRFGAEKIGLCTFHFMKTIFKVFRNTGIMETFIKEKRAESEYSLSIGNIFSIYVLPYNRIHEKAGPIIDKIISFEDNIDIRIKWLEFKNYFLNNWSNIETAKMLSKYGQHTITTNDIEIYHASLSRYVKMGPSLGLRRYTEALLHLQLDTEIGIKQLEIERFKITSKEKEMENYRSNDLKYAPRLLQRIKMNDKNEAFDDYIKSRDSNRFLSAITKIRAVKKVKIEYGSCDDGNNDNENVHKQWFTDMNIENIILNEIGITFSGERSYLLNVHISTILGYESLYKIENKKLIDDGLKLIFENGLCKYENVFMPMNTAGVYKRGSHWILGHLSRSKNCFFIYDSLNSTSEDVAERVVSRIRNAHNINLSHSVPRNIPQQNNGYDCGAFVCLFATNIIRGKRMEDWEITREDVELIRKNL